MKKYLILFSVMLLSFQGFSQANNPDSLLVKNFKLNFALPDLPAFKALGIEPSNLLRPSIAQDFSFVSSDFFNGKNSFIPASFAVEVSPILLMNTNKMTLSEFRKGNALKTSRISLGTNKDSLNATAISLGYRISLINKGDIRTDSNIIAKIAEKLKKLSTNDAQLRQQYLKLNNINATAITDEIEADIAAYVEKSKQEELNAQITALKKAYKEANWNAEKLDMAFAVMGKSTDSLFSNAKFKSVSFWTTYARPAFKNKGQMLIGINYQFREIEQRNYHLLSVSNRNYLGTNKLKIFFEEQLEYNEFLGKKLNLLLNLGAELNLKNGFWIDLNAGYDKNYNNNVSKFVSQLRFRYTLPE